MNNRHTTIDTIIKELVSILINKDEPKNFLL